MNLLDTFLFPALCVSFVLLVFFFRRLSVLSVDLACNAERAFFTNDTNEHNMLWTCPDVCKSLSFLGLLYIAKHMRLGLLYIAKLLVSEWVQFVSPCRRFIVVLV